MNQEISAGPGSPRPTAPTARPMSPSEAPSQSNSSSVAAPSLSLPKGGGAIRGMGEKFAANPVAGTGSLTIPVPVSPGRAGFGPQLSLSYDSGAGNGPFGFGWNLSLPVVTRKTEKGLPQYRDSDESDVFVLSGAEDLVPLLGFEGGNWIKHREPAPRVDGSESFRVERYRPRIEGLFARIERWTSLGTGEIHWRSITKDNLTTLYGRTSESRIEATAADSEGQRTFSWLICESFDDKGNVVVYRYQPENSDEVSNSLAHEQNRLVSRSINRYHPGNYDDHSNDGPGEVGCVE